MEYAGYKGLTEGIDLAGLTDKLATKVSDIGKDRVKRKEELDTLASESAKKLSEIEMTKTESLNEKLLALGDEGRNKIAEWNSQLKAGNLSPSEYKKRMAGITEYTSLVGSTAKNFDAQMQEYIKRQADKTGSAYELATMEMYGKMADIKNTQYKVLDDGRIAIGLTDPETGEIINQKDLRVINKSENMMTPRMNLNSEVNSVVKNWGADGIITYLGRGGYKSSASAANDPKFGLAKKRVVQALVTQNAISLLVDNGGLSYVDYAFSESDKDKKISQAVKEATDLKGSALTKEEISDIETGMILVGNDGKPVLTDAQLEKARKIAEAEIDLQVDNELKTVAPQPVSYSSTSAGEKAKTIEAANAEGYKLSLDVMTTPAGANSSNNGYLGQLRNRALAKGENLYFERFKDSSGKWGIRAYPIKTTTVTNKRNNRSVSEQVESIDKSSAPKVFMTAQQLSPYIWNENNAAEAQSAWKMGSQTEQGAAYYGEFQAKIQNKPTTKPATPTNTGLSGGTVR